MIISHIRYKFLNVLLIHHFVLLNTDHLEVSKQSRFSFLRMSILQKIADIESEMARTQKNKATSAHLGLLKGNFLLIMMLINLYLKQQSWRSCGAKSSNPNQAAVAERAKDLMSPELEMPGSDSSDSHRWGSRRCFPTWPVCIPRSPPTNSPLWPLCLVSLGIKESGDNTCSILHMLISYK